MPFIQPTYQLKKLSIEKLLSLLYTTTRREKECERRFNPIREEELTDLVCRIQQVIITRIDGETSNKN